MKRSIDKLFLIISIIIGILFAVPNEVVYSESHIAVTRIPAIFAYLIVFAVVMGIILLIKGLQNGTYVHFGKIIAFTLLATIAFGGFTVLFEYLYEKNFSLPQIKKESNTQYVFVIDDSGTMETNDKYFHRYEAVQEIVNGLTPTRNFAVYTFESVTECVTPMGTQDSQSYTLTKPVAHKNGATFLGDALRTVLNDVSSDTVQTNVIVLTDGEPSDLDLGSVDYRDIVSNCNQKNTTLSSVGFGNPDETFLQSLADDTGGVFVYADDITNLTANMGTIVSAVSNNLSSDRDLLGPRYDHTAGSFLYGFLRVLFLILLGALWTIVKMLLVGEKKFMLSSMIWSFVLCTVAAILCELLNLIFMPGIIVRAIFLGLWACTIVPEKIYDRVSLNGTLNSAREDIGMSIADDFNNRNKEVGGHNSFL